MPDTRRRITRNRTTYSCQNCRRRKIKCTKTHPSCAECLKTNEKCVYSGSRDDAATQGDVNTYPISRKRKLTTSEPTSNDQRPSTVSSGNRFEERDAILNKLSLVAERVRSFDASMEEINTDVNTASLGRLSEGKESDVTVLSTISSRVDRLLELLDLQYGSGPDLKTGPSRIESREQNSSFQASQQDVNLTDTLQKSDFEYILIPSKEQSNVLFRKWLSSVYPVLPIINPGDALIRYEAFHQWYGYGLDKGNSNPVKSSMPMVFAIHYGGIVSMSTKGLRRWWPGVSRRMLLSILRGHFMQAIRLPESRGRNVVAAMIMMRYLCHEQEDKVQAGASLATIIRSAQALGLHRQPPSSVSTVNAECDRRLWWEIMNLDINLASACILPPLISECYNDATFPEEIKDINIETVQAFKYKQELVSGRGSRDTADDPQTGDITSMVSVYYIVCRARALIVSSTQKLVNINLHAGSLTIEDMSHVRQVLETLEHEIRAAIDRIPFKGMPELDFVSLPLRPEQTSSMDRLTSYGEKLTLAEVAVVFGDKPTAEPHLLSHFHQLRFATVAFHKWARIYLSTLLDQTHSLSYGPFLRNTKSKLWLVARSCLLKHCHSFMRKYIALATDEELQCFRWTWTAMFQSMHSTILMLLDVYERPDSPEAARSRALFDQVLSLTLEKHGIVGTDDGVTSARPLDEGGQEVKSLLMGLRTKAWQKACLDPGVLWTEADQIQVGVARIPTDAELLARSVREDAIRNTHHEGFTSSPEVVYSHYQEIIRTAAGELLHPSEVGILPNTEDGFTFPFNIDEIISTSIDIRLIRARHDQEPVPLQTQKAWLHIPQGHTASINDISQLLRKIKSVKLSTKGAETLSIQQSTSLSEVTTAP